MRLLFDNGVPATLRRFLTRHEVSFARDHGWAEYANGRLIAAAEQAGFEGVGTCDKNWSYQQNLKDRRLAFVVLPTNIWPHLQPHLVEIVAAIDRAGRGLISNLTCLVRRWSVGRLLGRDARLSFWSSKARVTALVDP